MSNKEIRWKQRFENFQKAYELLEKYTKSSPKTELGEQESFNSQGYNVKSPRDAIKTAVQMEIIKNGYIWMDALSNSNLTTHTYDEAMAEKVISLIMNHYFPAIKELQKASFWNRSFFHLA
ncbi:nucleotidyltransferase substrate binding protein [Alteribacillus sp. JSM 102045]|uniref:nucleotidyltransferase substrate binding protein n=1 Tax=Alteribacillus sp. JSM 102045 TaxID=1562101 RepID=UPI0035C19077